MIILNEHSKSDRFISNDVLEWFNSFTVVMLLISKGKIIWIGGLPAVALESV